MVFPFSLIWVSRHYVELFARAQMARPRQTKRWGLAQGFVIAEKSADPSSPSCLQIATGHWGRADQATWFPTHDIARRHAEDLGLKIGLNVEVIEVRRNSQGHVLEQFPDVVSHSDRGLGNPFRQ